MAAGQEQHEEPMRVALEAVQIEAAQLTAFEEARMRASSAKRKLERVSAAVQVLDEVLRASGQIDHATQLLEAEEEVAKAHTVLTGMLEQSDGGDSLKRPRVDWHEACGMCEFVRAHDLLRQYLPAVERETAEARERWEVCREPRQLLTAAKSQLARLQGRFYALLELGFTRPEPDEVAEQRDRWAQEESACESAVRAYEGTLAERRAKMEQFYREQGWRKGAERFGALVGLTETQLLSVRLSVLEADATNLRLASKATLALLGESKVAHERTLAELNACDGKLAFLTALRERVCTPAQLQAEEYEAGLEAEVLRGTLSSLAPRAVEALHLRLAWHSKAGARKAGRRCARPISPSSTTRCARPRMRRRPPSRCAGRRACYAASWPSCRASCRRSDRCGRSRWGTPTARRSVKRRSACSRAAASPTCDCRSRRPSFGC